MLFVFFGFGIMKGACATTFLSYAPVSSNLFSILNIIWSFILAYDMAMA